MCGTVCWLGTTPTPSLSAADCRRHENARAQLWRLSRDSRVRFTLPYALSEAAATSTAGTSHAGRDVTQLATLKKKPSLQRQHFPMTRETAVGASSKRSTSPCVKRPPRPTSATSSTSHRVIRLCTSRTASVARSDLVAGAEGELDSPRERASRDLQHTVTR